MTETNSEGIAIIGLAAGFGQAANVGQFLAQPYCRALNPFPHSPTKNWLPPAWMSPRLKKSRALSPHGGVLKEAEWFDAAFFGMFPKSRS